jgi:hypothetical protein
MLFVSAYKPRRPAVFVLTDAEVKGVLTRSRVILRDGPVPVEGRIIGWKRTDAGPLGAVVANPITGARFLVGVDLASGGRRPRVLTRLG